MLFEVGKDEMIDGKKSLYRFKVNGKYAKA